MPRSILLCVAIVFLVTPTFAQTTQQLREATSAINEFLDVVCIEIEQTTGSTKIEAEARLEVGLRGLVRRLLDIDAVVSGGIEDVEEGVSPEDLASLRKQEADCRSEMTKWVWESLEFSQDFRSGLDPERAFAATRVINGFRVLPTGLNNDQIGLYLSVSGAKLYIDNDSESGKKLGTQRGPVFLLIANWVNDTGFSFGGCDLEFQSPRKPGASHINFVGSFLNRTMSMYDPANNTWNHDVSILGPTGSEMDLFGSMEDFSLAEASLVMSEVMAVLSCQFGVSPDGFRLDSDLQKTVLTSLYPMKVLREAAQYTVQSRQIDDPVLFNRIGGHNSPYLENKIEGDRLQIILD